MYCAWRRSQEKVQCWRFLTHWSHPTPSDDGDDGDNDDCGDDDDGVGSITSRNDGDDDGDCGDDYDDGGDSSDIDEIKLFINQEYYNRIMAGIWGFGWCARPCCIMNISPNMYACDLNTFRTVCNFLYNSKTLLTETARKKAGNVIMKLALDFAVLIVNRKLLSWMVNIFF